MIIEEKDGLIKLLAEGTNKITNIERSFFSDFIYLGNNDSPSKYEEVGREIWKHFIEEENPDIAILKEELLDIKEQNKVLEQENIKLKSNQTILEDVLIDTDFRLTMMEISLEMK